MFTLFIYLQSQTLTFRSTKKHKIQDSQTQFITSVFASHQGIVVILDLWTTKTENEQYSVCGKETCSLQLQAISINSQWCYEKHRTSAAILSWQHLMHSEITNRSLQISSWATQHVYKPEICNVRAIKCNVCDLAS